MRFLKIWKLTNIRNNFSNIVFSYFHLSNCTGYVYWYRELQQFPVYQFLTPSSTKILAFSFVFISLIKNFYSTLINSNKNRIAETIITCLSSHWTPYMKHLNISWKRDANFQTFQLFPNNIIYTLIKIQCKLLQN